MDDELVLLTSYFNLANGRRQDTADTFRVDPSLASGTSPDGTAALYVVSEASTGGNMGPRARRLAVDTIAWEYSSHGDEAPPRRLKAALQAAHEEVLREFDGHVSVGASVIAVEGDDIFLAQAAPAQVYVLHEGSLHSIAAGARGSSPYGHGLGSKSGPETSLFRDAIAPSDVIALCSSWYHRSADPEELRECFAAGSADDIAEALLDLARDHDVREATVIVIEATPASELDRAQGAPAAGLMEQVDVAVQALATVGKMLVSELRGQPQSSEELSSSRSREPELAGVGASSGSEPYPYGAEAFGPSPSRAGELERASTSGQFATDEPDLFDTEPQEQMTEEFEALVVEQFSIEQPETATDNERAEAMSPGESSLTADRATRELEEVNSRLQQEIDMKDVVPPVQAFPDTGTEPSRIYASSKDIQAVNRRPRRFGGVSRPAAGSAGVTTLTLGHKCSGKDLAPDVSGTGMGFHWRHRRNSRHSSRPFSKPQPRNSSA